jgi:hypothetical protein
MLSSISGLAQSLGADRDMSMVGLSAGSLLGPFSTSHPLGISTLKIKKYCLIYKLNVCVVPGAEKILAPLPFSHNVRKEN